jgi:hypothetical protein
MARSDRSLTRLKFDLIAALVQADSVSATVKPGRILPVTTVKITLTINHPPPVAPAFEGDPAAVAFKPRTRAKPA